MYVSKRPRNDKNNKPRYIRTNSNQANPSQTIKPQNKFLSLPKPKISQANKNIK